MRTPPVFLIKPSIHVVITIVTEYHQAADLISLEEEAAATILPTSLMYANQI